MSTQNNLSKPHTLEFHISLDASNSNLPITHIKHINTNNTIKYYYFKVNRFPYTIYYFLKNLLNELINEKNESPQNITIKSNYLIPELNHPNNFYVGLLYALTRLNHPTKVKGLFKSNSKIYPTYIKHQLDEFLNWELEEHELPNHKTDFWTCHRNKNEKRIFFTSFDSKWTIEFKEKSINLTIQYNDHNFEITILPFELNK